MLGLPALFRLPSKLRRRARRRRMATLTILLALLLALVIPFYVIYRPPALLIRYFARRWPDVLWQVDLPPAAGKVVALTIDDAPSEHTPAILDVLAANAARATFFVIGGQVPSREGTLRAVARAGHELANHGMHDEPARGLSDEELEWELRAVRQDIQRAYSFEDLDGPRFNYFRPGSGFFSDRIRAVADKMGYRLVLGSVYPHDAQVSWPGVNAAHILSMVRPGAIIICHDRRSWTLPMLKTVLPELKRRGYKVVTVTELLEAGGQI